MDYRRETYAACVDAAAGAVAAAAADKSGPQIDRGWLRIGQSWRSIRCRYIFYAD